MGFPEITGFGHIDLTVTNGERSAQGGPLIVLRDPDNIQLELRALDPDLGARRSEKPSA